MNCFMFAPEFQTICLNCIKSLNFRLDFSEKDIKILLTIIQAKICTLCKETRN